MNDVTTDTASATDGASIELINLTADITSAYLAHNSVRLEEIPNVISSISNALSSIQFGTPATAEAAPEPTYEPAVPPRSSVKPDAIISLIDGKPYKTLKRHLGRHGLTPDQYRARYGLKADYPMVAPSYSARRSDMAKSLGLGRKRTETADAAPAAASKPKRTRKAASEQTEAAAA